MKTASLLITAAAVTALCAGSVLAQEGGDNGDRLDHYPPVLHSIERHGEIEQDDLHELKSPDSALKAFEYIPVHPDAVGIVGVVDSNNRILWQYTTGVKAVPGFCWNADSKYLFFWTWAWQGRLYAKTAREEGRQGNYLYVIEAKTGKIIHEVDPDVAILHLDQRADPLKMHDSLVGVGSVVNAQIKGDALTVTEKFVVPDFIREDPGHPIPDWYKHPLVGSIKLSAIRNAAAK